MPVLLARAILSLAAVHLAFGAVFAVAFHARGLARVDPTARGGSLGFRVLVTPGVVLLWPILLVKWRRAVRGMPFLGETERPLPPRSLRALHAGLVRALAVLVPIALALALAARPPAAP